MKLCTKCGETKELNLFCKNKRCCDGRRGRCKACSNAAVVAWRALNPDKYKESAAAYSGANKCKKRLRDAIYRSENVDKIQAARAAYRDLNIVEIRMRATAYHVANFVSIKAAKSAWDKANPEKKRAHAQNRRVKKLDVCGKLSTGLASRLLEQQYKTCGCGCGQPLDGTYHMDHWMPLFLGGSNTDDNIRLLTPRCNLQKGRKHPDDYLRSRGFLL